MKPRKYKVKYGYNSGEYAVVDEGRELEKVVYAWQEGIPVSAGGKMFSGKQIISIEGHYHSYTGWNEFYQPKSGEDWAQIQRDCPDFLGGVENAKEFVNRCLQSKETHKIGSGDSMLLLE